MVDTKRLRGWLLCVSLLHTAWKATKFVFVPIEEYATKPRHLAQHPHPVLCVTRAFTWNLPLVPYLHECLALDYREAERSISPRYCQRADGDR